MTPKLLSQATARGIGISDFVSVGNKSDVSGNDLLQYWDDDPRTDVIALYLESFGNPRRFARLAPEVATRVRRMSDAEGYARDDDWAPGNTEPPPAPQVLLREADPEIDRHLKECGACRLRNVCPGPLDQRGDARVCTEQQNRSRSPRWPRC